jgi:hypothetical protein
MASKPIVRLTASPVDGRLELVAINGDAALGLDSYPRESEADAIQRGQLLAIVFDATFEDVRG